MVNTRVASATEGAAPKIPAKLFGRTMSPRTAKNETTAPPIRNLNIRSIQLSREGVVAAPWVLSGSHLHPLSSVWRAFSWKPMALAEARVELALEGARAGCLHQGGALAVGCFVRRLAGVPDSGKTTRCPT